MKQANRYKENTPAWVIRFNYLKTIAANARKSGNIIKSWIYAKRAETEFVKAGGLIINV